MFKNFIIKLKKNINQLEIYNIFVFIIIQLIRKHIFKVNYWKPNVSYSQLGEDLAIQKLIRALNTDCNTFLDIGSYHPIKYSNTRILKKNKWKGIHVDASKASITLFKKIYPEDCSINAIISNSKKIFINNFDPDLIYAENTFSYFSSKKSKNGSIEINKSIQNIDVLSSIDLYNKCKEHFGQNLGKIGFLNIDIEGLELDFLKKWPIKKCIFEFICVENHAGSLEKILTSELHVWLSNNKYRVVYFFKFAAIYEFVQN